MSAGEFASSLIQFVIVVGVTFALLCLITSHLRFQRMADQAGASGGQDGEGATTFQVQIAQRLGRAHRDPEPFVVILIRMAANTPGLEESVAAISRRVHQGIRARDTLLRIDEHTLGSVVGGTRTVGLEVATRILDQFSAGEHTDLSVHIGVASFPENGQRGDDLLAAAHTALEADDGPAIRPAGAAETTADSRPIPTPEDPLAAAPAGQRNLLDPVTGFLREDHLGGVLHKRIAQCRKDGLPGSVMTAQVDHLDRYLDHYGPDGIETILRHLGCYLQGAVREDDLLARHGDDHIVLIMTASPPDALTAAQRIAEGVRDLEIDHAGARLKVTLSIGVAGYPDHGASPRKLLDHATAALETAKARGRNLCLAYQPGMRAAPRAGRDATAF